MSKDTVREVLEKDPKERTEEDIDTLVEYMQNLPVSLCKIITTRVSKCFLSLKKN